MKDYILVAIVLLSFIAIIVGFIKPKLVVWYGGKGRPEVVLFYLPILLISVLSFGFESIVDGMLFIILSLSFTGVIVGLMKPNLVIWFGKKTRVFAGVFYSAILLISFISLRLI